MKIHLLRLFEHMDVNNIGIYRAKINHWGRITILLSTLFKIAS